MALMGAMIGCMDVAMNANAVDVEKRLGRAIMSSSHGFWSLGGFFGGALGSWLLALWGSEAQALWAAAVAGVIVLENLGYRQLNSWWRLVGLWRWATQREARWGEMKRKGLRSTA